MLARARFRPAEHLDQVAKNELIAPKTVYLTPAKYFDSDWKYFQKGMKSMPVGVRFAYKEKAEAYKFYNGFVINSGYDKHVGRRIHFRAEALMESGIHGLWRKWEQLGGIFHAPRIYEESHVRLSLSHLEIRFIFHFHLLCILTALGVLQAELIVWKAYEKSCVCCRLL